MKALMCGSWSPSMVARASRNAPASSPRGTERMSSWRCSMSDSSSASGPSNSPVWTCAARSGRGSSVTRTLVAPRGPAGERRQGCRRAPGASRPAGSGSCSSAPDQDASSASRSHSPATGSRGADWWRMSSAVCREQPAASASSAESDGCVRIRSSAVREAGQRPAGAPDPRPVSLAERPGHPVPEPRPGSLRRVVEQAREQQVGCVMAVGPERGHDIEAVPLVGRMHPVEQGQLRGGQPRATASRSAGVTRDRRDVARPDGSCRPTTWPRSSG